MALHIIRKNIYFKPDPTRVLARPFNLSEARTNKVILRILSLKKEEQEDMLRQVFRNFSKRHRSIVRIFEKNYKRLKPIIEKMDLVRDTISYKEKLLIGAYFTMEYSIEAAAFFNPSIIEDVDQTQVEEGSKRVIISFRATGEGHVSSIVFRSGIIDSDLNIQIDEAGTLLERPTLVKSHQYDKETFVEKLYEINTRNEHLLKLIEDRLTETFTYEELRRYVNEIKQANNLSADSLTLLNQTMWLASSHYEMSYSLDTDISERVIFPLAETEKSGIEDARFVRFIDDKGQATYYATYTAYDGVSILPKLLMTKNFINFKVIPINGKIADKGAALFPRKIDGKYAMLCRIDGENNYISYSESINIWHDEAIKITEPKYPWEFIQLGNGGSPIETEEGWLVITHSVGPMREYVLSAMLLDLETPEKVIGRLNKPLLLPNKQEREGYVPNVVYTCGSLIHNDHLIIPYAMSDHESTYATVCLADLIEELLSNPEE